MSPGNVAVSDSDGDFLDPLVDDAFVDDVYV